MFWLGTVGTAIGAATLVAAAFAALYARRAWLESKRSVDQASRVSDVELRPWIAIDVKALRVRRTLDVNESFGNGLEIDLQIVVNNLGKTVAFNYIPNYKMSLDHDDIFEEFVEESKAKMVAIPNAILPGDQIIYPCRYHAIDLGVPWRPRSRPGRYILPVVKIIVYYKSSFDDIWHTTERTFMIGKKVSGVWEI